MNDLGKYLRLGEELIHGRSVRPNLYELHPLLPRNG